MENVARSITPFSTSQATPQVWQLSDRLDWALGLDVAPLTKLVAVAIARCAGKSSGLAWPGMGTLAKDTGLSRSSVIRAVAELEHGEHLTITRLKIGKKNAANRYRLPAMGGGAETPPSVCVTPPPSVCVTPEPVRTLEPVKKAAAACISTTNTGQAETKQPVTDRLRVDRHTCPKCGNDWPVKFGTKCFACQSSAPAHHPAGQAAPVPGKYNSLFGDDDPKPDPPPLTPEARADLEVGVGLETESISNFRRCAEIRDCLDLEADLVEKGWRKSSDGWVKAWL